MGHFDHTACGLPTEKSRGKAVPTAQYIPIRVRVYPLRRSARSRFI